MDAQTTVGAGLDAGASRRARAMAASLDKPPAAAVGPWVACGGIVSEQPARRKHAKSRLVSEPARPRAVGSVLPLVPFPDLTRLSIVLRPGVSSVVVDVWARGQGRDAHRSARAPAPGTSFPPSII